MESRSNVNKNYGRIKTDTLNHREVEEITNGRRSDKALKIGDGKVEFWKKEHGSPKLETLKTQSFSIFIRPNTVNQTHNQFVVNRPNVGSTIIKKRLTWTS